ncbi:MAG TPA: pitrilysin family protein [Pseudomonadota bacterium]|nr:pitrilysin family protein [Pseudomonadota bacterium]HNN50865.1 pitrilysin family protein [Pseudomonadota bacterium]
MTSVKLVSEQPFGEGGLTSRLHELPNGLKVLLLRDPSAPVFAYQTWFSVGSRHEREGKTGIAHLFEHLMFNETQNLPHGEFDRRFELAGGNTNAATWVDWTYYQDDLPSSELELAVTLEAERMQNLLVRERQVETERGVVISERQMRVDDDVDGFMSEELFRRAYTVHPYMWPTIGWMQDIKNLNLDDCVGFYRTYYAPNNATVVVVGDIDEQKTLDLIVKHYGGIAAQPIPPHVQVTEPPQNEPRLARFKKPVVTDRILFGYKAPALHDPDHLRLELLSELLIGGPSSPIYRDLVIEREIFSSLGGSVTPFRDPGLWEIAASLHRGHSADEGLSQFDAHIAKVVAQGPSQAEVDRARARMLTSFYLSLKTAHGKASSLGESQTTLGDYRELWRVPDILRSISVADLHAVAKRYLDPAQRTVVIAEPSGEVSEEDDGDEEGEA